MVNVLKKAVEVFRAEGLRATWVAALNWLSEHYWERRLGISTIGFVSAQDLGLDVRVHDAYSFADYRGLRKTLKSLSIRADDVFLDVGSGMGRPIIVAAMFPFRKVIGVEFAQRLNDIAQENIRRSRRHLRCQDLQVVTTDAVLYPIPPEVSVIFLFNPFKGEVLRQVFANIRQSLAENPRPLVIVVKNTKFLMRDVPDRQWLRQRQVIKARRGHDYVIYDTVAQESDDGAG